MTVPQKTCVGDNKYEMGLFRVFLILDFSRETTEDGARSSLGVTDMQEEERELKVEGKKFQETSKYLKNCEHECSCSRRAL